MQVVGKQYSSAVKRERAASRRKRLAQLGEIVDVDTWNFLIRLLGCRCMSCVLKVVKMIAAVWSWSCMDE